MALTITSIIKHLLRCFALWLTLLRHQITDGQQTIINVQECTGDGMKLRIQGPFSGDVLVNQQFSCRLPVGLLDGEHMSFLVPYGEKCGVQVDEDGKATANLVLSERTLRSTTGQNTLRKVLTCQYPVSKRVVGGKPAQTADEREKLDVSQQSKKHHAFWPNNVESDKITIGGVNLGLDKRVDFIPRLPANDQPKTVFLNRDRSFARSVSVDMMPDPQILQKLHRRKQRESSVDADDAGFLRVSRRISVNVPQNLAL